MATYWPIAEGVDLGGPSPVLANKTLVNPGEPDIAAGPSGLPAGSTLNPTELAVDISDPGGYNFTPTDYNAGAINDTGTTETTTTDPYRPLTQVTPGTPVGDTQINIQDYAGQVAHDPQTAFSQEMLMGQNTTTISDQQTAAGEVAQQPDMNPNEFNAPTAQGTAAQGQMTDPRDAVGYNAAQTQGQVTDMTAAQGNLSQGSQVNIQEIDTEAIGQGLTETGKALNAAAILDLNDIDSRATLKGQIDILQDSFKDSQGNPIIPPWASGLARNVSKIAAFKGITGSAATEAMSNALLESSIKIAEQDAKFFQTVTLKNLDNKQQQTINKANVLANMDIQNLDARTTAAVENAKHFMSMDLANLTNEQQAAVINTQQRFQSILEDAKSENTARMFLAENQNDLTKFYDQLNAQMEQFNVSQFNAMEQFNTDELNSMFEFNSKLADSRDKFEREMAYNIDIANAKWRQEVTMENTRTLNEAAALDVKNMVNMSQEQLNKLWDRSDSLLDYLWKSTENQLDRDNALIISQLQAGTQKSIAEMQQPGFLDVIGTIAGKLLGNLF